MKKLFIILMLFWIQESFGQTESKSICKQDSLGIVIVSEIMPEFQGGTDSFYQFLRQNIEYPHFRGNVQGTVVVKFVIDTAGKVCTPEVIISLHPLFDEEVLRVVSIMPDWKPALCEGKPISTYFTLPIKFFLN